MKITVLRFTKVMAVAGYFLLVTFPLIVSAAVTLQWNDSNDPDPEGFNLYQRVAGESYNYSTPLNSELINGTNYFVDNLQPGVTYYFVVRAYSTGDQSADSNEVEYTEPETIPDRDHDGIPDSEDAFPDDPDEWVDSDHDGIGNNADTDDDNDGMPDSYESQIDGLDPLIDDADGDLDGDHVSNRDEYENGTDPSIKTNYPPETPVLSAPAHQATVSLTPDLAIQAFSDPNGDIHFETRYQIALDMDFTDLVFDRIYADYLTELPMMDLILEPETTYYWRAMVVDDQGGESSWSEPFSFTTMDFRNAGDENANGILDNQEVVDMLVDLDGDLVPDAVQSNLMCVAMGDSVNPYISVSTAGQGSGSAVVALRALETYDLSRGISTNRPDNFTGLINFKVYLDDGENTVSIVVYFSAEAPEDAAYYYHAEDGWVAYPDAVFSDDRQSVTITVEDGGTGDQDGIQNGVIVDPAGLGYRGQLYDSGNSDITNETSCFIATPLADDKNDHRGVGWLALVCGLFLGRAVVTTARRQRP